MEQRRYVDLLLAFYLEECGLEGLKERLLYCMLEIAHRYSTLTDADTVAQDFSEDAGLGIVMIHIILRAIGFSTFSFSVGRERKSTVSTLSLDTRTWKSLSIQYENSISD